MRLHRLTLQHFRNIAGADLRLAQRQHFLLGPNGQGKTNLLEAVGFLTALRSFRTAEQRLLIAQGQPEAVIVAELEHEQMGATRVAVKLRPGSKEVWIDATRVTRLADFIGQFPTVVFSSQDQQLLRGSPGGRRRWLDLTLAATDAGYLSDLQAYHQALAARNALLKRQAADAEITAFERPLARHGAVLMAARARALEQLARTLTEVYAKIAQAAEPAGFAYSPDQDGATESELLAKLESTRARDRQLRATGTGPHRDDFTFLLSERAARDFASEGQQRSLVLALRLAQSRYFHSRRGVQPVLLADDVLGELDPDRRRRFWAALSPETQVIATGTAPPDAELGVWQVFGVSQGTFAESSTAPEQPINAP